jgi:hypothetical protein
MEPFSIIQIVSTLTALLLAATRILSAARPLWSRTPSWLAAWLPTVVLVLPQIAEQLMGATDYTAIILVLAGGVALLVPGAKSKDDDDDDDDDGGSGPGSTAALVLIALLFPGCAAAE